MKNKHKTIAQKLYDRKYHIPNRAVYWLYYILSKIFILHRFHPQIVIKDDINKCQGPCFIVWNHLSRIDHAYLLEAIYPRRMNILSEYNEFYRSHLHLPFQLMNVLPKKNYASDVLGIKAIMKIIKQGGCVGFAPEGISSITGANQPVVSGTGHMLKHFGVPVYFLKMRGEYLANTKVCLDKRIGKCEAELSLLFTTDDLAKLSKEEIENKLNWAFKNDEYEWGRQQHIEWKKTKGRMCYHLSDICYRCPKCGKDLTMVAEGDQIKCTACGNGAKMNDFYEFEPFDDKCVIPVSPSKWVAEERMAVIKEIRKDPNYSYSVKTKIGFLPQDHYIKHHLTSELAGEGTFTIDHQGVHFVGTRDDKPYTFDLDYTKIYTLVIVTDMTQFSLYVNEEYVEFHPEIPCVGKLLLLTEEMHRLHVNTWKCFPWDSYMYENLDK